MFQNEKDNLKVKNWSVGEKRERKGTTLKKTKNMKGKIKHAFKVWNSSVPNLELLRNENWAPVSKFQFIHK